MDNKKVTIRTKQPFVVGEQLDIDGTHYEVYALSTLPLDTAPGERLVYLRRISGLVRK